jgi:iron complex transport system substrate-binding protein
MVNKAGTIASIIFALILGGACSEGGSAGGGAGTITDRAGRQVTLRGPINRVVSTAPSNTEIIFDLGMADKLVAIDVHSANIPGLPDGLPLLDFFFPDAEVILALKPDVIIASGHNPTGTGDDPFRLLGEAGIPAVYIPMSKSVEDIYLDIAFIAELLGAREEGEMLVGSTRAAVAEIADAAARVETKKTVYFEISPYPDMMTFGAGSYIDDMISTVGAINVFGNEDWLVIPGAEALIARNPDVILTNVNFIDDPVGEIKNRPGFNHIAAVINDRVHQIDNDSSVRPSARILKAMREMQRAVYPELNVQR